MNEDKSNPLMSLSTFIVDKRNAFFLVFTILVAGAMYSATLTEVNDDITSYLDPETEIRQGLNVNNNEFIDYAMAEIMVSNVSLEQSVSFSKNLENIQGVNSVVFDETNEHYISSSARFVINFEGEVDSEITVKAMDEVLRLLDGYDVYVSTLINEDMAAILAEEMGVVMIIAIVIILSVLLFTSKTYMEIPVLLLTFGVAAILNVGSHFLLGEISFVSNSIAVVLQLALGIDYAIILCHRFFEEREHFEAREATIYALSKAIPEVSSSSMTTISGLAALMFMQFQIGLDMGVVLIKAILFSLLSVFTLMPGLLVISSNLMDKTKHKNFVPSIRRFGTFIIKTRKVIPLLFLFILFIAFYISNQTNYVYGYSTLETVTQNEGQIAKEKIKNTFGKDNPIGVIVPSGKYELEGKLIKELESLDISEEVIGLANIEGPDDYTITDKLTPRQFSEMTDMDIEEVELLYGSYAVNDEKFSKLINGLSEYKVPIIDMFIYIYEQKEEGYISLNETMEEEIDSAYKELIRGKKQLESDDYSRILLVSNLAEEGTETFNSLDELRSVISQYYDESYIIGESVSNDNLGDSFAFDNILISVLSALFVMLILMFTFKSSGLPVLLVLCILGSIWINFSFPPIQDVNIFFLSYLVVTSIQMGATIDYAIVITSRYMELRKETSDSEAIILSLDQAFPTILTSGSILASAGILIGRLSSDYAVSSIGTSLGRGTIISIIIVMAVLPQILIVGSRIIDRTAFELRRSNIISNRSGYIVVNGMIRGEINGFVEGVVKGRVRGEVKGIIDSRENEIMGDYDEE